MSALPCEAIVAEFVFGPKRCHRPSVTTAIDDAWGSEYPVCAAHAPTTRTPEESPDE